MSDRWGEPIIGKKTVKKGETLTEISKILDLPVDSLVSFNNLSNPNDIKVGQELLYRKEPGFWDNTFRWAFESSNEARDSREINNQINNNIKNKSKNSSDSLDSFFNLGEYTDLSKYLKDNHNLDLYTNIENLNTLYKFFRDKNWSRNQTLAILSSIIAESGGDPYKKQIEGSGYGLLQYTDPARKQMMLNYKSKKYPNNELLRQAEFIDLELRGNKSVMPKGQYRQWLGKNGTFYTEFMNPKTSLDRLTSIITTSYIRPGKPHLSRRINLTNILNNVISKNYNPNLVTKNKNGGIIKGEEGLNISTIKIDPSIFTSWNAIKLPEIKIKNKEDGSGLSDYLLKDFNSFFYTPPVKTKSKEEENNVNDEGEIDKVKNNPLEQQFTSENKVRNSNTYYYNNKEKWISDLTEAYKKAGITNPEALKYLLAQDALESGWGKSAQGNYNFGNLTTGSSWKGNYVQGRDKDAAGNPISQKFRSYNSMDEYTKDKINFLTRLYDFNQDDDFQTFISKLTGSNKGHRRYAEARNYGESLTKIFQSLIGKHQGGGTLNWTSEDLHNPVYKKGWTPESDKKALKNIKKEIQETRNKNFKRIASIAYGIARLIPGPVGLATDITDIGYELYKNKSLPDSATDAVKFGSWLLKRKFGKGIDLVNDIAKDIFGGYQKVANTVDTVQDSKQLYNTVNKHQEGGTLLFGNPETLEMLTYQMPDGSIKTVPNPGAGFVSGTDPIGVTVVEGAVLNKPLGWLSSKAINWAKGLLGKRNIAAGNFSKGEEVVSNSSEKNY